MWISLGNNSFIPYNDVMLEMETLGGGALLAVSPSQPPQPIHNLLLLIFCYWLHCLFCSESIFFCRFTAQQVQKNVLCLVLYFG